MADAKISALPASTIPLAGTEVLPIVQSGVTKKVANNDLRPKQIQSNATSGVLQVVGPASAATRVMTTPDANFSAARIDAAQSFTGDQTLSTGNLVIGTAGKGIDFSADPSAAGMTSELLDDYEEGTYTLVCTTPGVTTSSASGTYTKIGNRVTITGSFLISAPGTASGAATFTGLPFTNGDSLQIATISRETNVSSVASYQFFITSGSSAATILTLTAGGINWSAGAMYTWSITYKVA